MDCSFLVQFVDLIYITFPAHTKNPGKKMIPAGIVFFLF